RGAWPRRASAPGRARGRAPPLARSPSTRRRRRRSARCGRTLRRRGQPELTGDRLHGRDHGADVVVELDAELLRAAVDLVPVHAGRERRLLQLLPHRLRLEALEAGRPYEGARMDEAGELVAGEERLLERRVARHGEVLGVREHGLDDVLGPALLAEDRRTVLRMLIEGGVDLVVEVVQEGDDRPALLVLAEQARVGPHR